MNGIMEEPFFPSLSQPTVKHIRKWSDLFVRKEEADLLIWIEWELEINSEESDSIASQ